MIQQKSDGNLAPTVIDYEGYDYKHDFWNSSRQYEDLVDRIALGKLLPPQGKRLIEIGAGFGRLADLYKGYDQVVLLDPAYSLLEQAREQYGSDSRFKFVKADSYKLPFADAAFDAVVMVRVMHHIMDIPKFLTSLVPILKSKSVFVFEYANKRNLKAILRYVLKRQSWSPFDTSPYQFAELHFDFHPQWMDIQLNVSGLRKCKELGVSMFRIALLKRLLSARLMASIDGRLQELAAYTRVTPSIYVQAVPTLALKDVPSQSLFKCLTCNSTDLFEGEHALSCSACGSAYPIQNGTIIFD